MKMMLPTDRSPQDEIQQRSSSVFLNIHTNEQILLANDCTDPIECKLSPFVHPSTPSGKSNIGKQEQMEISSMTMDNPLEDLLTKISSINPDIDFSLLKTKAFKRNLAEAIATDHRNSVFSFEPQFLVAPVPPDPAPPPIHISVTSNTWTKNYLVSKHTIILVIGKTIVGIEMDTFSLHHHVLTTSRPTCLQSKRLLLVLVEKYLHFVRLKMESNTAILSTFEYEMSDTTKLPKMSTEWSTNVYVDYLQFRAEIEKKRVSEDHVRYVCHCYWCSLRCSSDQFVCTKSSFVQLVYQQIVAVNCAHSDSTARIRESVKNRSSNALRYKSSLSTAVHSSLYCHRCRSRSSSRRFWQKRFREGRISVWYCETDRVSHYRQRERKTSFRSLSFKRNSFLRSSTIESKSRRMNDRTKNVSKKEGHAVQHLIKTLCTVDPRLPFPSVVMMVSMTDTLMLQIFSNVCEEMQSLMTVTPVTVPSLNIQQDARCYSDFHCYNNQDSLLDYNNLSTQVSEPDFDCGGHENCACSGDTCYTIEYAIFKII
ncbi:uncharacterized protein LOC134287644 [Aedes albopictus]|uniref:Uncharacterized protein n=1 Tax=Aedes albopictus TaxID=7160 RepID=A0ABM1ZPE7_AEDAL